jgi:hypothetical protein
MTNQDEGAWRDDQKLPLSELTQAMATYSQDGQVDDLTGSDAGAEEEFGHGPLAVEQDTGSPGTRETSGDPDPTSEEGRRLRPSPDGTTSDGRSGPS